MTPRHTPARIPSTLRDRARQHRRLALAALRADQPPQRKLSRYWSHIGQARALEALTTNPAAFGLAGGAQ